MKKILSLLLILFIAGCSSSESDYAGNSQSAPTAARGGADNYDYMYDDVAYNDIEYADEESIYTTAAPLLKDSSEIYESRATVNNPMFIKTANISIQTDAFDDDLASIKNITDAFDGYYESSNLYAPSSERGGTRRFNATIRIPAQNYETAKLSYEELGWLFSSNENTQEVSAEYFNTQSRLETLRTEEKRVIELIEEADELALLITLEGRLGDIRSQIDIHESRLKRLEDQVSYSTIVLNMTEVTEQEIADKEPDDSLIARIKNGFQSSLDATLTFFQAVVIFMAYIILPLIFITVLAGIILIIIRRKKKNKQ